jgi:Tfp pilus assembly protein PilO
MLAADALLLPPHVLMLQADELEALRGQQQQLQADLVETAELRVKVSRMQEVVADLPALQEELQQLQAAHEASLEQSRQLQAKVGCCLC